MMGKKIILAAGGTGGHVFPAFAVAEILREQGHDVRWATDPRGLKYKHHWHGPKPIVTPAAAPANKAKFALLSGLGVQRSLIELFSRKPDVVIGFGGYPCVPMVLAAQALKIPTLLHESNATIGAANKFLLPRARNIAVSFPSEHAKAVFTGNPVRPNIAALAEIPYEQDELFNVLVFGGSLGARIFEEVVPRAMAKVIGKDRIRITQQVTNEDARATVAKTYRDLGLSAVLVPFVEDMASALKDAHLVICRSGATSVAELTVAGRPSVLIPATYHADNQQYANARTAEEAGGAIILDEKSGVPDMVDQLSAFINGGPDWAGMAAAMKSLGNPRAAWTLADLIVKTAL